MWSDQGLDFLSVCIWILCQTRIGRFNYSDKVLWKLTSLFISKIVDNLNLKRLFWDLVNTVDYNIEAFSPAFYASGATDEMLNAIALNADNTWDSV